MVIIHRSWYGRGQFAEAAAGFAVGTVFADAELEAERKLRGLLADILPPPMPLLASLTVFPGQIIVVPEGGEP